MSDIFVSLYFYFFFIDLYTGMKTNAAEISKDMMTGPSIFVLDVMTMKNNTPHSRMKHVA